MKDSLGGRHCGNGGVGGYVAIRVWRSSGAGDKASKHQISAPPIVMSNKSQFHSSKDHSLYERL